MTRTHIHTLAHMHVHIHTHPHTMDGLVGWSNMLALQYTHRLEGTVLLSRATSLSKAQTDIRHPALFLSGSGQGKSASQRER